jgi:hypothetical protein
MFTSWLAQADSLNVWLPGLAALVVIAVLVFAMVLPWWVRRRRRVPAPVAPTLKVNVAALPEAGPPESGPALRIYNVPVRLAMVVLAPVGRGAETPAADEVSEIIDQIVPGLGAVAAAHGSAIKVWPAQLSSQGFLHQFSVNVGLPGDAGKGTPWCSACGRFEADGTPYLAGLLLCAAKGNSLGQFLVERESQWPDMLRVNVETD